MNAVLHMHLSATASVHYVTVRDAAKLLRLYPTCLYGAMHAGLLDWDVVEGRKVIDREELARFADTFFLTIAIS